jgi:NAD(P)-dependent dehydrogenase (short-subunit alcohol dehydrogenase family)
MCQAGFGRLVAVVPGAVKWLDDGTDELGVLAGLGVLGLNKSAVADLARFGVTTNAVLRGEASDPGDVAAAVAFLLSGPAGYLQGVALSLDGATSPAVF